jgi:phage shock protein C
MSEIPVIDEGPREDKLYRSRDNRVLAGVCGGIGKHFNIDPTIIRILWILFSLAYGAGLLIYIICIFIIPEEPEW